MDDSQTDKSKPQGTRQPADTALKQQRMNAWSPILDPVWVIATLFIIAACFIPTGIQLKGISDNVVEMVQKYDSYKEEDLTDLSCAIDKANEGKECTISFTTEKDMEPPILVYYEIANFHQNHRNYITSRDDSQLLGNPGPPDPDCAPLDKLGNVTLNPCGLIANTFFNDVISLDSGNDADGEALDMIEQGIAWTSDLEFKFGQVKDFKSSLCNSCSDSNCDCSVSNVNSHNWTCKQKYEDPKTGECSLYSYPDEDTTQYLYETYPKIISPLEGVENEHFVVWMRAAALPDFRKLYGYFNKAIKAGTTLTFKVDANWDVKSFKGSKSLVVTTTSAFGGKNPYMGNSFIVVGAVCLIAGAFFTIKQVFKPRKLAETKYLRYKED
jgi:hypothetical protein